MIPAMDGTLEQLDAILPTAIVGSIVRTEGLAAAAAGLPAPVGAVVEIERLSGPPVEAAVIGFRGRETIVYPLGSMAGVRHGSRVRLVKTRQMLRVGQELLGRTIDAGGQAIDRRPPPPCCGGACRWMARRPRQRTALASMLRFPPAYGPLMAF